jgi:Fic family protein
MIYTPPAIGEDLQKRLAVLGSLRQKMGAEVSRPSRWMGSLRREVRATSIESSTSIEGYSVDPAEALALTSGESEPESGDENRMAVSCYARAMDHVGVMAQDPYFRWLDRVILDLHFDACYFQRDKDPGYWRTGEISVTGAGGRIDYRGPPGEEVPPLMAEIVGWLDADEVTDVIVKAAIAHLNVVSVHPFRDGTGRVSRIVQSLVLARKGEMIPPEFSSIEEYLGDHTADYYAALREVQGGSYQPQRDASNWVGFCIEAHIAQAQQRLAQIEVAAGRWSHLEELVAQREWPERFLIALEQSLMGGSDRSRYTEEAEISPASASNDFRRLLDSGLITQSGRGRTVRYRASADLLKGVDQATGKAVAADEATH